MLSLYLIPNIVVHGANERKPRDISNFSKLPSISRLSGLIQNFKEFLSSSPMTSTSNKRNVLDVFTAKWVGCMGTGLFNRRPINSYYYSRLHDGGEEYTPGNDSDRNAVFLVRTNEATALLPVEKEMPLVFLACPNETSFDRGAGHSCTRAAALWRPRCRTITRRLHNSSSRPWRPRTFKLIK